MKMSIDRAWIAGVACMAAVPACAAEWSVTPNFASEFDHSSNRVLREDAPGSESLSATLDVLFARRTEDGEFTFAPHARVRRFTDDVQPDADDFTLSASLRRALERGELRFGGRLADESTLTTELAQTGLVRRDASRRTAAADAAWSFTHDESRRFDVGANYEDVAYRGAARGLFGYRYGSVSMGEAFLLTPRLSLTPGAFASRLDSPDRGSRSAEQGMSLGMNFDVSEHTSVAATFGVSRRDLDGRDGRGTTRSLALQHRAETGGWSFEYDHRLVPYGTGVLTQQDSAALTLTKDLSPRWRVVAHAGAVRHQDAGFGITFDDRTYRYADTALQWGATEHWSVGGVAGYADADDLATDGVVRGWSLGLRGTWTPNPRVFGH